MLLKSIEALPIQLINDAIKITNITSSTILENMGEVLKKKSIEIREAVRLLSIGVGQGFQHCDCTTKCINV